MVRMVAADGRPVVWLHLTSPAVHSSSTVRRLVRASGEVGRTRCSPRSCRGPTVFTPFSLSDGTPQSIPRRRAAVSASEGPEWGSAVSTGRACKRPRSARRRSGRCPPRSRPRRGPRSETARRDAHRGRCRNRSRTRCRCSSRGRLRDQGIRVVHDHKGYPVLLRQPRSTSSTRSRTRRRVVSRSTPDISSAS